MSNIVPTGFDQTTGQKKVLGSADTLTDQDGTEVGGGAAAPASSPQNAALIKYQTKGGTAQQLAGGLGFTPLDTHIRFQTDGLTVVPVLGYCYLDGTTPKGQGLSSGIFDDFDFVDITGVGAVVNGGFGIQEPTAKVFTYLTAFKELSGFITSKERSGLTGAISGLVAEAACYDTLNNRMLVIDDSGTDEVYSVDASVPSKTLLTTLAISDAAQYKSGTWDQGQSKFYAHHGILDVINEINLSTGVATAIPNMYNGPAGANGLTHDGTNDIFYLLDKGIPEALWKRTAGTDRFVLIAAVTNAGLNPRGLAYDKTNNILYLVSNQDLYTLNVGTAVATLVGSLVNSSGMRTIAWDDTNGILYGVDDSVDNLFTINTSTGVATAIGAAGALGDNPGWRGLCWDLVNTTLMLTTTTEKVYTVNTTTGVASLLNPDGIGQGPVGWESMSYDSTASKLMVFTGQGSEPYNEWYDLREIDTTLGMPVLFVSRLLELPYVGVLGQAVQIAYRPSDQFIYAMVKDKGALVKFDASLATPVCTIVRDWYVRNDFESLAFDSNTNKLFAFGTNALWEVNRTTGAATYVMSLGSLPSTLNSIEFNTLNEPTSLKQEQALNLTSKHKTTFHCQLFR